MTIESRINLETSAVQVAYLDQLTPEEAELVKEISAVIEELASQYDDAYDDKIINRDAIFGVYAIGSMANRPGETHGDIDLLVVTNAFFPHGYYGSREYARNTTMREGLGLAKYDNVVGTLVDRFSGKGFGVELIGDLPDGYTEGDFDDKALLRLTPPGVGHRNIDIVCIKGAIEEYGKPHLRDFDHFYDRDIDESSQPLDRVALLELIAHPRPGHVRE